MLKFSKIISYNSKNIVKENSEYLGIFHLLKWKFQKLINYSMEMCWSGQGTTKLATKTKYMLNATRKQEPPINCMVTKKRKER
jgi:hypothetical protein